MKIAYLVCFVALLQVSISDSETGTPDTNSTFSELDLTSNLDISNSTDLNTTDLSTSDSTLPQTDESDDQETDSVSYSAAAEDSTTVKEEEPTTVQPSPAHGYAAFLQPSLLALVVPVCLRLSSIKLLGVV